MAKEPTWQERIQWCLDSGMTSDGVAESIGLQPKAMWDLENGRTKKPTGMTAVKLFALSEKCRAAQRAAK